VSEADDWQGWQLGGSVPDAYEKYLVPAIFVPWATRLVELAGLSAPGTNGEAQLRVLDVACGTGIVARLAAAALGTTGNVTGLDLNAGMLAVAAREAPDITWQVGDAEQLPFEDDFFDFLFCQFSLQFFPDRHRALTGFKRVLRPGGRFLLSLPCDIDYWPGANALAASLQQHVGSEAAAIIRAPFSFGDTEALRAVIVDSGFTAVALEVVDLDLHFPSAEAFVQRQIAASPLAGPIGELDEKTRTAVVADAVAGMQSCVTDDGLVLRMRAHVGSCS
jgi:ubiquinone/menaquinone biosynthesis C-methylase UbiE